MEFPQDYASRVCLNQAEEKYNYWGLLVIVDQRVADLQRWNEDGPLTPPERPGGLIGNFEPDGQRLKLYMGNQVVEWNLVTGWAGDRPYQKGEKKRVSSIYQPVAGEPQFRAGKDWCCVIIDGAVKATSPQNIFRSKQKEWNQLSAAEKSILLSEKARKSSAKHAFFGAKAAIALSTFAAICWGLAWVLTKLKII